MTENEKKIKLEELAESASFLNAMKDAESKQDIQRIFHENGLDLSGEEVDAFVAICEKEQSDELDVEDLDTVAGGVSGLTGLSLAWMGAKTLAKAIKRLPKTGIWGPLVPRGFQRNKKG